MLKRAILLGTTLLVLTGSSALAEEKEKTAIVEACGTKIDLLKPLDVKLAEKNGWSWKKDSPYLKKTAGSASCRIVFDPSNGTVHKLLISLKDVPRKGGSIEKIVNPLDEKTFIIGDLFHERKATFRKYSHFFSSLLRSLKKNDTLVAKYSARPDAVIKERLALICDDKTCDIHKTFSRERREPPFEMKNETFLNQEAVKRVLEKGIGKPSIKSKGQAGK
jgi:hypothetical protein